jgi:hypothetical protein
VDPTNRLIAAIGTADVSGLTGAGDRSEGTVEKPNDLAEVDISRIPGKAVAASLPFPTLQDSVIPETEKDELEEFRGDLFGARQIGDAHGLVALLLGKGEQGLDGVLCLFGEHEDSG